MTHFTTLFTELSQDWVIVLLFQSLLLFRLQETVSVDVVHLRSISTSQSITSDSIFWSRILSSVTLSTSQLEQTVVWLRSHYVVLDFYYLTISCTHQSSSVVTVTEFLRFITCNTLYPILTSEAFSIHSNQRSEAVATVNVHTLSHRAKAVSSINVATVFQVVLQTPVKVVLIIVVRILPI